MGGANDDVLLGTPPNGGDSFQRGDPDTSNSKANGSSSHHRAQSTEKKNGAFNDLSASRLNRRMTTVLPQSLALGSKTAGNLEHLLPNDGSRT